MILSGNARTRPHHAATLIEENYTSTLYYTDQKKWHDKNEAILGHPFEEASLILATYNLKAVIIPSTKGGATSTFDEAYDFVQFLHLHPMKHVILVTDSFHTARAHYAFRKILDLNGFKTIKLEMAAAPNTKFNENNWWKSEAGISAYILEPIKFLFYLFHSTNTTLIKEN